MKQAPDPNYNPAAQKPGEKTPHRMSELDTVSAAARHLKWFLRCDRRLIWSVLSDTFTAWNKDNVPRLSAALAYYTSFSIAPLLILLMALAGLLFGERASKGEIFGQIRDMVGYQGASAIQNMLQTAHRPGAGIVASVVGILILLLGASSVVSELENALDTLWGAPQASGGILEIVKYRFHVIGLVLAVGFILLVSLVLTTWISVAANYITEIVPGGSALLHIVNTLLSLFVTAFLFAAIYKFLPNVRIAWSDVIVGAAATAVLFSLGKLLIGLYLGKSSLAAGYGTAASLAIFLAWVYYSAQIFYFGAEFTQVYASRFGSRAKRAPGTLAPGAD
jgi:membrane protein